jgi:hypothetical protein
MAAQVSSRSCIVSQHLHYRHRPQPSLIYATTVKQLLTAVKHTRSFVLRNMVGMPLVAQHMRVIVFRISLSLFPGQMNFLAPNTNRRITEIFGFCA